MKVIILGCATSTGVPIVGCKCDVCLSESPKNKRTRCSLFIQVKNKNLLIDTSPDLRIQALKYNITLIHAVLYTHSHADHTHGIDDLRTYNFINRMTIPCFGNSLTINNLKRNFAYIFDGVYSAGGKPKLILNEVSSDFEVEGIKITPIDINHADWIILGYRIGNIAYLTDCSGIPDYSYDKLQGLDVLIIDALRQKPHAAHFSVDQALEQIEKIKPKQAVFTHMGHELDYDEVNSRLPDNIIPAYDGLEFNLDDPI